MEEWFLQFIGSANGFSIVGYIALGVLSFLESTLVIGLFVPGTTITLFAGFLVQKEPEHLPIMIFAAALGTALSYHWGFNLGDRHSKKWLSEKFHVLGEKEFEKTHQFFQKYGIVSVLVGRFLGPIRPFIAFVAGMGKMERKKFHIVNWITAFVWSITLLLAGFLLGEKYAEVGNIHIKITFILVGVGTVLLAPYIYRTIASHWKHHKNPPDIA